jgi:hypothetical protein
MGAPSSAIIAETYLQNLEHNQIYNLLKKYKITGYFRYVDDIMIVYDKNKTHINTIITEFKTKLPTINFTVEKEKNQKLHFLDLIIHREHNKLDYMIYKKPTATDILIHNSSCHPNEHKLASINYLTNRVHTYPLSKHVKDTELNTIKTILQNNQWKLTQFNKTKNKH